MVDSTDGPATTTVVAPQLSVRRGREAIDFYRAAFGAVELYRVGGSEDQEDVVAQLAIDGATFWVSDESVENANVSPETIGGATTRMLLQVADPDTMIERAVAAGARLVRPATDEYHWRLGRVEDPYGHHWEIRRPLIPWPPSGQQPAG